MVCCRKIGTNAIQQVQYRNEQYISANTFQKEHCIVTLQPSSDTLEEHGMFVVNTILFFNGAVQKEQTISSLPCVCK